MIKPVAISLAVFTFLIQNHNPVGVNGGSTAIHLSSQRQSLVEVGVWVWGSEWTWVTWEADEGYMVVIHNETEL